VQSLALCDRDTLTCWLRSYSEAIQQQTLSQLNQQKQAQLFFGRKCTTNEPSHAAS
jgi:hypothetical protein